MRKQRLALFILGLGLAALPASATITYSACTAGNGCTADGTGTYANWQAAGPSLTFTSLLTFSSANLSGGVYTDPVSGVQFTNYTTGGSVDTLSNVDSSYLHQGNNGNGSGFEIDLPANTYAIALDTAGCGPACGSFVFMQATFEQGTQSAHTTPEYDMTNLANPQFFGLVSSAPITSIFFFTSSNTGLLAFKDFEIGTQSGSSGTGDVPEPSTVFTLGGGFLGLFFWQRRRRRAFSNR